MDNALEYLKEQLQYGHRVNVVITVYDDYGMWDKTVDINDKYFIVTDKELDRLKEYIQYAKYYGSDIRVSSKLV